MALTVDYSVAPFLITIPKSDLSLVTGTQYQLTVDAFWILLRDFTDNESPMAQPKLYSRIPATSSTPSITEIEDTYYRLEFEDGLYSVNIINGNTNIREVEVKNQVSVNTNNTTGFINPTFLESGLFAGQVSLDVVNGVSGTGYTTAGGIVGTRPDPVNNVPDAVTIANARGLDTILIIGDITMDTGDDVSNFIVKGQNPTLSSITINTGALTTNTTLENATIAGTLDGNSTVSLCSINNLNYVNGAINDSKFNGTITLGGTSQADFRSCYSGVAGQATPILDCGGSGQSFTFRNYDGGIKITNKTGTEDASIDLASGQVQIDLTTVTNGSITIRGTGKVVNAADTTDHLLSGTYGSLTIYNETTTGIMIQELWQLQGLDPDGAMTVTPTTRAAGSISLDITGDGVTTTTVTRP